MTGKRLFAIALIFGGAAVAWLFLGETMRLRTRRLDRSFSAEMEGRWGPRVLVQTAPYLTGSAGGRLTDGDVRAVAASRIAVDVQHDHRYMGLLWYGTFTVRFEGRYTAPAGEKGYFIFPLPAGAKDYDGLEVTVGERGPVPITQGDIASGWLSVRLDDAATEPMAITVRYTTRGQNVWLYAPGKVATEDRDREDRDGGRQDGEDRDPVFTAPGPPMELRDFSLAITTNFSRVDYPKGTRSPAMPAEAVDGGMRAAWTFDNALTNQPMGMVMPRRANAGPIAARMSFFAPVSLLFFFVALLTVVVLRKIPLHPMHYLFIAAGFFAFHILLAYLVDLMNIHGAFWICAAVSVVLVVSYMRLVAGVKFALSIVGLAQLVYLVGFSYAFFWEGKTGLMVTIGAILTLFVLMQATGRLNWHEIFRRPQEPAPAPTWTAATPPPIPLTQPAPWTQPTPDEPDEPEEPEEADSTAP